MEHKPDGVIFMWFHVTFLHFSQHCSSDVRIDYICMSPCAEIKFKIKAITFCLLIDNLNEIWKDTSYYKKLLNSYSKGIKCRSDKWLDGHLPVVVLRSAKDKTKTHFLWIQIEWILNRWNRSLETAKLAIGQTMVCIR